MTNPLSRPVLFTIALVGGVIAIAACAPRVGPTPPAGSTSPPPVATDPSASPPLAPERAAALLPAYAWELRGASDASGKAATDLVGREGRPVTLRFDGGRLVARNLCNTVSASYAVAGDRLTVTQGVSTLMACSDAPLMGLERRVVGALPTAQRFALWDSPSPRLSLVFADGSRWDLAGTPTPESRYGGPAVQMFLEIAAARVDCRAPMGPETKCLSVRTLEIDAKGAKTPKTDWETFSSPIEGYTHEDGVRSVLRVQRYPTTRPGEPVAADRASYAYVLDLVVESHLEK